MLRAAVRSLLRQPSFTLAAAGDARHRHRRDDALFTTVNAALLRPLPLPYARPGEIYSLRTYFRDGRFTMGMVANEELTAVDVLPDVVSGTAFALRVDGAIDTDVTPRQVVIYAVSQRFFDLFGVPVESGRSIRPDDTVQGTPQVAVLSHALWRAAFGARPDMVGRTITLSGRPVRVVGIAPPAFDVPTGTDVWTNLVTGLSIGRCSSRRSASSASSPTPSRSALGRWRCARRWARRGVRLSPR